MRKAAIAARGLSRRQGARLLLRALDWSVAPSSVHALFGLAGAGKTLLLRLALGFARPDSGTIEVLGSEPRRSPRVLRRRIGYLPQAPALAPGLSPQRLLAARRAASARWDAGLERRIEAAFELGRARAVGELDRCARRGLELLLALAPRPELALLDDPCAEEGAGGRMAALLAELAQCSDATLVVTSARVDGLEPFATEIAVLCAGRLVLQAPRDELRSCVREIRLPLDRYLRIASACGRAGILCALTLEEEKRVVVRGFDAELARLVEVESEGKAAVRPLELAEIVAAGIDLGSTGTGTRP